MVAVASLTGSRQFQRYYDGRRIVVGCIPYRYKSGGEKGASEGKVEVLVITSQKGQGILFPKGGLEIGESVREGACRETREEAGVRGKIQDFLGHWTYKSKTQDTFHEGLMYSLLVTKQLDLWQEKDSRQRIWMDIETAREKCRDWWMREALETLIERLAKRNQENLQTTFPISEIEIKDALFSIQDCKASGPYGCPSSFFKKHWDLMKADLVDAVQEFFTKGKLLEQLNATAVALVPRGPSPSSINDFRPIPCCNVIYKVIYEVIANRVKKILGKLISESQGAFVQGHNIRHNILLCPELVKHYGRTHISPRCCLKVDLRKVFDSLPWGFIADFPQAFNFPPPMVHWILQCITTTKFSIIVNGELHGFFEGKQGLRKGDLLSLYIFVLAMEYFSRMMHILKDDFQFNHHPKCRRKSITIYTLQILLCFLAMVTSLLSSSLRRKLISLPKFLA